jgi:hypothetical protein
MRKTSYLLVALVIAASGGSAFGSCSDQDVFAVGVNIAFCGQQCSSPGHQQECNGWGKMRLCGPNDVRNGFTDCHGRDSNESRQMTACFNERPDDTMRRAREVLGCAQPAQPSPPPTPPPPPPVNDLFATAVHTTGTAWEAVIGGLTDEFLPTGYSFEVYITPRRRLPFFAEEIFLTKQLDGTLRLKLLFDDRSRPPVSPTAKPTVHLHHPAP